MNFALPSVVDAATATIAVVVVVIHLNCVSYSLSPIDVLIFLSNSTHWLATAVRNSIISCHCARTHSHIHTHIAVIRFSQVCKHVIPNARHQIEPLALFFSFAVAHTTLYTDKHCRF